MQITAKRVVTVVTLVAGLVTSYQILSRPQPVATPQSIETLRANAQSFDEKVRLIETSRDQGTPAAEVRFTSDEVSAALAQSMGHGAGASKLDPTPPNLEVGSENVQINGYQVKLEGDTARGQFAANIAGKDVWVTLVGHLGSQDGYVTFNPTEFKIGDLTIPVSLVNSALQRKLAEQREQLKLPQGIESLRVENGELVIVQK